MQYNDGYSETLFSFANGINTVDGGSHVTGFRAALTRTLNEYGRKAGLLKEADANLTGDDVREGLTAAISVKLPERAVRGPDQGQAEQRRGAHAGRERGLRGAGEVSGGDAGRGASASSRSVSTPPARATPPAAPVSWCAARTRWIRRCPASWPTAPSAIPQRCELYIVEGDSAGGQRQAGARPPLPGDPAAARQDPQRRARAAGQDAGQRADHQHHHGARRGHRRVVHARRSCATGASSS